MRKDHQGIVCLLNEQAEEGLESFALLGNEQSALTYQDLRTLISVTNRRLIGAGLCRGDRVALVISNGPEAATAFLSIAAGHVCAPLNPAYRSSEFHFYFSDLKPKAVIIEADLENEAAGVAAALRIPIFYLHPAPEKPSGAFTLETHAPLASEPDFAGADDVALVLHTSGTTSRPKIVPLTHSNLIENARNIAKSLELRPHDRCLNVMPLFHVHGLIGAVLSSLSAGASVYCSRGFQAARFFSWFDACKPTWFTAVPTMHQAILARAADHRNSIASSRLRFIRSCSSALPPQVMARLEEVFRVPAVEAYGMTEASHQMACNPLPPGARKPGSVGIATGPDIAIMAPDGNIVTAMTTGEIVIRGTNVTGGYGNNSQANAEAFTRGWFRTGDQGYLDNDGYLFINGRTKEMINRGGEKISPREIDEALMDHPAVQQAVAFSLPDPRLGEDVAAAVVLRDGMSAGESELREFVGRKLAGFKVPRKIVFVPEIPKGPTGKLQRIGLAQKLQIDAVPKAAKEKEFVEPRNSTEARLANIWREVLGCDRVGVCDSFFDLGGDSAAAAQLVTSIAKEFRQKLDVAVLLESATIEHVAQLLTAVARLRPRVSTMYEGGAGTPFFLVHAHPLFRELARQIGARRPVLTLAPPPPEDLATPFTLANLAAHHVQSIREVQPHGPYFLAGWCHGGVIAYEIARQLQLAGGVVAGVAMFDSINPQTKNLAAERGGRPSLIVRLQHHATRLRQIPPRDWSPYLAERLTTLRVLTRRKLWRLGYKLKLLQDRRASSVFRDAEQLVSLAVTTYQPGSYDGPVVLIRPQDRARSSREDHKCGWGPLVPNLRILEVPGNHRTMFESPNVTILGETLCEMMDGDMPSAAPATTDAGGITPQLANACHAGR